MRIAVNTRLLLRDRLEGIGWFAYETLSRIVASHPEHEFIFIFDRRPDPSFVFSDNVKAVVAHPQARHPILWYLFFEYGVARVLKREKPDLFLSPDGWLSLRSGTKQLAVIHDLNFEAHPAFLPRHIARYYHRFFPRFARKATRIATVSEFTKRDLETRYKISSDKIDVVYNGASSRFHPYDEAARKSVRQKYTGGRPYFLFVGLIHPRKNLENQLRAYISFRENTGADHCFVVVGERYSWSDNLEDLKDHPVYGSDIIFTGRQGSDTLADLYGAAFALMYVSYFEGFGIPILEAFHAEIPVVTSTRSSMPEICADAGLLAKPDDVTAISNAMQRLAENEALREELIEKGRRRRVDFSWDRTADLLWESVMKATRE